MKRLYVGGAFDMLHRGHVELLRRASELGEVWVGISSDEYNWMNRVPVMTLQERREPLEASNYVSGIVVNNGDPDSKAALLEVHPDYIVHGDDWLQRDLLGEMGVTKEWLQSEHIGIMRLSYGETLFSPVVLTRIEESVLASQPPPPED